MKVKHEVAFLVLFLAAAFMFVLSPITNMTGASVYNRGLSMNTADTNNPISIADEIKTVSQQPNIQSNSIKEVSKTEQNQKVKSLDDLLKLCCQKGDSDKSLKCYTAGGFDCSPCAEIC